MKKKWIITGLTCVFLLFTGICYSCNYQKTAPVLISATAENKAVQETEQGVPTSGQEDTGGVADTDTLSGTTQVEHKEETAFICVHICGAVMNPGVYQVEAGARLVDLIKLSGGLQETAAGDYINQAATVTDGQRIYIPDREELKSLTASEYQAGEQGTAEVSGESTLININTADAEALMSLPGIGQAKADNIIAYRASNGCFKTIEDLMNIPGIKQGLFSQISSRITVD